MFKVKVDKQTQSHRCQTAGKVSGGPAEAKYVETSLFTSQAEVQLLSLFSCIFTTAHRVRAIRRSKVQPSCPWYTTWKCVRPPPQFKGSLQVLARSMISSLYFGAVHTGASFRSDSKRGNCKT